MRKQAASLVSGALLMGGLSGCDARSFGESQPHNTTVAVSAETQGPFDAIAHYWEVTRGLGKLGISVTELPEGDSYTCDRNSIISPGDPSPAYYCPPTNTMVILPARYEALKTEYVNAGGDAAKYPYFVLGHEYGHGLEKHFKDSPESYGPGLDGQQRYELLADCLDGEAGYGMSRLNQQEARTFYQAVGEIAGDDPMHGSVYQRDISFEDGQIANDGQTQGCGFRMEQAYPQHVSGV